MPENENVYGGTSTPVVVNTPPTPLDNAPAIPTGTYPELSPNPNLHYETKDEGRGTPVIVVNPPRVAIDPTDESAEIAILEQQIAGKQDKLTFDTAPTQNSTNPVTSGGVYNALQNVGGEDIVTITATGVQSDEMAAKIEAAKAVYYGNGFYGRVGYNPAGTELYFRYQIQAGNKDTNHYVTYTLASKTISVANNAYWRVSSIGGVGNNGDIGVDNSLQVASNNLKLTGKLPYLTSAPSADNTSGFMTIVVVSSEPAAADRKAGYLYIVVSA